MHEKHKANQNLQRKERNKEEKKINYKRGENKGTKGENHKPSSPREEPLRLQECNSQGQIFLQEV